jgi:hypothetical protein
MRGLRRIAIALAVGAGAQVFAAAAFRRMRGRHAAGRRHHLVTQGGLRVAATDVDITDAVVSVLMGGLELDLRGCALPRRPARIEALVVMGGLAVVAPPEWRIQVALEPFMGGVQDRRGGSPPDGEPDLVLTGRVVMGGVDITTHPTGPGARREPLEWAPTNQRGG